MLILTYATVARIAAIPQPRWHQVIWINPVGAAPYMVVHLPRIKTRRLSADAAIGHIHPIDLTLPNTVAGLCPVRLMASYSKQHAHVDRKQHVFQLSHKPGTAITS